jgi:hypothetical protein
MIINRLYILTLRFNIQLTVGIIEYFTSEAKFKFYFHVTYQI